MRNPYFRIGKHVVFSREKPDGGHKVKVFKSTAQFWEDRKQKADPKKQHTNPPHTFTREQVIAEMQRQDLAGRRGRVNEDGYLWMVKPGRYRLIRLPVKWLDAVAGDEELAVRYASSRAAYPPILAYPRRDGTWYVAQGNHRAIASILRGSREIRAFVPAG